MSCGCNQAPCACQPVAAPVCPPEAKPTKCDQWDGSKNCWVEQGDETSTGICMLDTMNECQLVYVLERDPQARRDMFTVTSDPYLLNLAKTVPPLPKVEHADVEQALVNKPNEPASIPFYALFRGQPPFSQ